MNIQDSSDPAALPQKMARVVNATEIFDCIKRVSRGIDRFDRALFLSAYHADAIIDAGAFLGAPDMIYDGGAALHEAGQVSTLHHLTNHSSDIDGDTAHAETYFLYAGRNYDGTNWTAGGRYLDRLERRAGEWKIAFRYTIMEWSGMIPSNEVPLFEDVAHRFVNGMPSRNQDDPSYRRPLTNQRVEAFPDNVQALGNPRRV